MRKREEERPVNYERAFIMDRAISREAIPPHQTGGFLEWMLLRIYRGRASNER